MRYTYLFGALVFFGAGCFSAPVIEEELENGGAVESENESGDVGAGHAQPVPEIEELVAEEPASAPAPVVKSFSVTARQWSFEPSSISVKKGDMVRLSIASVDVRHGFKLPTFGVDATLEPNQTTVVEFVADKVGTFSFFCSVFCGDGHGAMNGSLTVTE